MYLIYTYISYQLYHQKLESKCYGISMYGDHFIFGAQWRFIRMRPHCSTFPGTLVILLCLLNIPNSKMKLFSFRPRGMSKSMWISAPGHCSSLLATPSDCSYRLLRKFLRINKVKLWFQAEITYNIRIQIIKPVKIITRQNNLPN